MRSTRTSEWIVARGLVVLEKFFDENGLDWKQIAADFNVDPELGYQRKATIHAQTYFALLEHAASVSGNDAAGLEMGAAVPIGYSATFDYIALSAPSLRVGIQNWIRFNKLLSNAIRLKFEERRGSGILRWEISDRLGPRNQFIFRMMSWAVTRILHIADDPGLMISIEFSCDAPRSITVFQEQMGARIKYNQKHDQIVIPGAALSSSHRSAEINLYTIVEQSALRELQDRERSDDFLFAISERIGEALKNGENTVEHLASEMGMSPRTLQRKLATYDTSFRELTDEIRKTMAAHYLSDTTLPINEIAFLLGFSEVSAFSRSARSWFGVAPREYRRQQG